jgi:hypothetical protein
MPLVMPSASALLELWETGEGEHAIDRALTVVSAFSGERREELAALGVHQLDALLVECRILAFGSRLAGVATCAACGCEVEVELQLSPPADRLVDRGALEFEGRAIGYRVPNSFDLAAAATCADAAIGERVLQSRCIDGSDALDETALAAADDAIAALCAPADIDVRASCPACAANFAPPVDIVTIVWNEIAAYARRMLDDVDALALRYGWSESDILRLSDARRRHYLEGAG